MQGDRDVNSGFPIPDLFGSQPTIQAGKNLTIEGKRRLKAYSRSLVAASKRAPSLLDPGAQINFQSGSTRANHRARSRNLAQMNVPTSGELRVLGFQTYRVAGSAGSTITATGASDDRQRLGRQRLRHPRHAQRRRQSVAVADANDAVFDSLSLVTLGSGDPGTLSAANGLTLDFGGNITGFGTVSTPNTIAKPLINNGHITGNSAAQRITLPGYVKGVGTFDNVNVTGTFSPGLSPTIATFGNVALSNSSTLVMELGGTDARQRLRPDPSHRPHLRRQRYSALINGFTPAAGQTFNLFDGALTGTFDTLQLPTLAGLAWNTSQLYTNGIIGVNVAPPACPATTTTTASSTPSTTPSGATTWATANESDIANNGDGNGVTESDFNVWKQHYGDPGSGGGGLATATSIPVPEPAILHFSARSPSSSTAVGSANRNAVLEVNFCRTRRGRGYTHRRRLAVIAPQYHRSLWP